MKTKLLTLATIAVIALNVCGALAETCGGGSFITGNNGHEYCRSNKRMNWWSAYTWCKANGLHMVSIYEICPGWDGSMGSGCSNLNSSLDFDTWTSTASAQTEAVYVSAYLIIKTAARHNTFKALCY